MKKMQLSIKQKYGGQSLTLTVLFLLLIVLINMLSSTLTGKLNLAFDMTEGGIYQLTDETVSLLKALPTEVTITVLADKQTFENDKGYAEINEILLRYQAIAGGKIKLRYLDVRKNPTFLSGYENLSGLHEGAIIIENEKRHKAYQLSDLYEVERDAETQQLTITAIVAEQKITSALLFVNLEQLPQAEFITGHDESFPRELEDVFVQSNFSIKTTNLLKENFSIDTKLVILSAPQIDFSPAEIQLLDQYLAAGRDLIMIYDAKGKKLPVLERFAADWGVSYSQNIVVDPDRSVGSLNYLSPLIIKSELTASIENQTNTIMLLQSPYYITPQWVNKGYRTLIPLLRTSDRAYSKNPANGQIVSLEKENGDSVGSYCLGVMTEEKWVVGTQNLRSRVLFFTSESLISDELMQTPNLMNRKFISSLVGFLSDSKDLASIPPRNLRIGKLILTGNGAKLVFWLVVIILPISILGFGLIRWKRRRNM